MANLDDLAARKQLLIAQANLDRLKLTLAAHDVRQIVWPRFGAARGGAASSTATRLIRVAMPLLGRSRLAAVLRAVSIVLALFQLLRGR